MNWRVVVRPDAQDDVAEAAQWYEARQEGLGREFREAVIQVLDALADNPLLNCRQHSGKNTRTHTSCLRHRMKHGGIGC
jgi:hypothetical protein